MGEDIIDKMKKRKFKELSPLKKIVFFCSLILMFGTLIYTGLHLDTFNYRIDTLNDMLGCTLEFTNGFLTTSTCIDLEGQAIPSPYPENYTIADYYEERNNKEAENIGFDIQFTD